MTRWDEEPTLMEMTLRLLSGTRVKVHSRPFGLGARSSYATEHAPDLN